MQFKYCSFYGISAPVLLLFSPQEIDLMFENGMSGSVCRLLANLRYELLALKDTLGNKSIIDMSEDIGSQVVKDFINGLSMQLDKKFPAEAAVQTLGKSNHFNKELTEEDKDFLAFMASTTRISGNLIESGKTAPEDYVARFKNIFDVKRWVIREMPDQLSESEQQLVKSQLAALPRKPSGKVYIDNKSINLKETNPALAALLSSLYRNAFKQVDGKAFIDYIIEKLETILEKNPVYGNTLLGKTFPQLQAIQSVKRANYHNAHLVNGPLSTENLQAKQSMIASYLADCDSLLDGNNRAGQFAIRQIINVDTMSVADIAMLILDAKVFRDAGLVDAQRELVSLLKFLQSRNLLRQMLFNYKELLFLTIILKRLSELESGDALIGWGLTEFADSPEDINRIGVDAARVLKIGGVYVGYTQRVYDTILVTNKAFTRDDYQISQSKYPVLYDNVRLLRRYLLSLKERRA